MQAILGFAWLVGRGKAPDDGQRDDQGTQHEGAEHDMSGQHQQDGEGREAGHQEFDRIIDSAVAQLEGWPGIVRNPRKSRLASCS